MRRLSAFLMVALGLAVAGTSVAASDEIPGVLLSRQLMEARGLHIGDVVNLASNPSGEHATQFRIVGVYYDYSTDRGMVVMDWRTFVKS